jgi:rhamnosyltransferase
MPKGLDMPRISLKAPDEVAEVGLVLLTKNGAKWLPELLSSLAEQSVKHSLKVAAIDSGSEDESMSLLSEAGLSVHKILPQDFSHSRTRNLGASGLGEVNYILYLSQDALPQQADWLEVMIQSLKANQDADAVSACEVTDTINPFAIGGVASHWLRCSLAKLEVKLSPDFLNLLSTVPEDKRRVLFPFTNVCALYRADALREYPFDESFAHSEDIAWLLEALRRGRSAIFTSKVTVLHSGEHSLQEAKLRRAQEGTASKRLFGVNPPKRFVRCWRLIVNCFRDLSAAVGS